MSVPEQLPLEPEPDDERLTRPRPERAPIRARASARPRLVRRSKPRAKARHRRGFWSVGRAIAAVLVLVIVGAAVGGGLEAWSLKRHTDLLQAQVANHLTLAAAHLTAGKADVSKANSTNDPAPIQSALQEFDAARGDFKAAQRLIDTDPVLRQADSYDFRGYPRSYIVPRIRAVDAIAGMGLALADAGQDGAAVDASLIKPANANLHGGPRLIATLKAAEPFIGKITGDLQRAKGFADQVDVKLLPGSQQATFLKARTQIQTGLDGTIEFKTLEPALLEVLGANGARTYLVENLDPAELRGGGGFVGSYILVSADHGEIKLGTSGNVYDIDYPYPVRGQRRYVAPPNSLNEFATHGWVFGDSNFYADFPASARAGQDLFKRETGRSVDGVIGIDFWAVADMLQVTGPIAVPEYGTTVDAKTFPDQVVHRLLTEAGNVPGKKTFFPVVAAKVLDKLSNLDSGDWTTLLGQMNNAVTTRHMQVYFNNQTAQVEMANLGWTGQQLQPGSQEVVQEVEANYGGNKANYWLQRTYNVEFDADGTGKLTHHFGVTLKNQTPPGYEGGQDYRAYFRFYYPAGATDARSGGLFPDKYPTDEKPIGLSVLDGWYQMPPYSTYDKVGFDYTTNAADLGTGHRIYWEKEAGTLADKVHATYKVAGKTYTADFDLGQDRVIILSDDGIKVEPGIAGTAKLPAISI